MQAISKQKNFFRKSFLCIVTMLLMGKIQATSQEMSPQALADREMIFERLLAHLPHSSQGKNTDKIKHVLIELWENGVCHLSGDDEVIRPGSVGLQCLFEEMFVQNAQLFESGDFEIHTTMPSTPCCKLPSEEAKNTFLASFVDEPRLLTIDGRSASLDAISAMKNACVHLTYTQTGLEQRSSDEQLILQEYWAPKVHATCIETQDAFSEGVNGATYRVKLLQGNEIYFGIQASQAKVPLSRSFVVHLGTRDQPEIERWLTNIEEGLAQYGRTLFAQ